MGSRPRTFAYLDLDRLAAIDPVAYQAREPYPFANPQGVLTEDGQRELVDNPPDIALFERIHGKKRAHGQRPHDRLALEYEPDLPIPKPWRDFIAELEEGSYAALMSRLVGERALELRYHWHWATCGNSVSPHCDARRKLGSHIFYLNSEKDWDPAYGGETLVLDDGGRFSRNSAPDFDDFESEIRADTTGNHSFIFTRRGNSWHGVREIHCPEGLYRKVFIVVLNRPRLRTRLGGWLTR